MDEISRRLCGLRINYSHLIRVTLRPEKLAISFESSVAAKHARSTVDIPNSRNLLLRLQRSVNNASSDTKNLTFS